MILYSGLIEEYVSTSNHSALQCTSQMLGPRDAGQTYHKKDMRLPLSVGTLNRTFATSSNSVRLD